jgi:hypothetical protein
MLLSSTFTHSRVFTFVLFSLAATACGDDEGAAISPNVDAGEGRQSSEAGANSTAALGSSSEVSTCAAVASACAGEQDEDGVATLCLDVSVSGNEDECGVMSSACLTFCETGNFPASDAGTPGEEQCHEMGELCHEYDEGSGLGHLCHEVGHGGNLEWCSVIYSACAELCHIEASDGGSGHPHDESDATHHDETGAAHLESHDGGHHTEADAAHHDEADAAHHEPHDGGHHTEADAAHHESHAAFDAATDAGH